MKRSLLATLIVAVLALAPIAYAGGPVSATAVSVPASITVPESLTMVVTGGPFVIPNNGTASNGVTVAYSYSLIAGNHSVGVWGVTWFSSATSALSGGGVNIPSSAISEAKNAGTYAPCTNAVSQGVGVAGAVCLGYNGISQTSINLNPTVTTPWTDTYTLEYTGSALNAGVYTGTWNVEYLAP
jgi:hypothetical protein